MLATAVSKPIGRVQVPRFAQMRIIIASVQKHFNIGSDHAQAERKCGLAGIKFLPRKLSAVKENVYFLERIMREHGGHDLTDHDVLLQSWVGFKAVAQIAVGAKASLRIHR